MSSQELQTLHREIAGSGNAPIPTGPSLPERMKNIASLTAVAALAAIVTPNEAQAEDAPPLPWIQYPQNAKVEGTNGVPNPTSAELTLPAGADSYSVGITKKEKCNTQKGITVTVDGEAADEGQVETSCDDLPGNNEGLAQYRAKVHLDFDEDSQFDVEATLDDTTVTMIVSREEERATQANFVKLEDTVEEEKEKHARQGKNNGIIISYKGVFNRDNTHGINIDYNYTWGGEGVNGIAGVNALMVNTNLTPGIEGVQVDTRMNTSAALAKLGIFLPMGEDGGGFALFLNGGVAHHAVDSQVRRQFPDDTVTFNAPGDTLGFMGGGGAEFFIPFGDSGIGANAGIGALASPEPVAAAEGDETKWRGIVFGKAGLGGKF